MPKSKGAKNKNNNNTTKKSKKESQPKQQQQQQQPNQETTSSTSTKKKSSKTTTPADVLTNGNDGHGDILNCSTTSPTKVSIVDTRLIGGIGNEETIIKFVDLDMIRTRVSPTQVAVVELKLDQKDVAYQQQPTPAPKIGKTTTTEFSKKSKKESQPKQQQQQPNQESSSTKKKSSTATTPANVPTNGNDGHGGTGNKLIRPTTNPTQVSIGDDTRLIGGIGIGNDETIIKFVDLDMIRTRVSPTQVAVVELKLDQKDVAQSTTTNQH